MDIIITINTDSAAFVDEDGVGPQYEVARILRDLARRWTDGLTNAPISPQAIRDINGNTVGKVEVA